MVRSSIKLNMWHVTKTVRSLNPIWLKMKRLNLSLMRKKWDWKIIIFIILIRIKLNLWIFIRLKFILRILIMRKSSCIKLKSKNLSWKKLGNRYYIQNHFIHWDFIHCFSFMGISFIVFRSWGFHSWLNKWI